MSITVEIFEDKALMEAVKKGDNGKVLKLLDGLEWAFFTIDKEVRKNLKCPFNENAGLFIKDDMNLMRDGRGSKT
jgi:hypothetical protein